MNKKKEFTAVIGVKVRKPSVFMKIIFRGKYDQTDLDLSVVWFVLVAKEIIHHQHFHRQNKKILCQYCGIMFLWNNGIPFYNIQNLCVITVYTGISEASRHLPEIMV